MLRGIRETLKLRITGAKPEICLNRWSSSDLPFWSVNRESELDFSCRIYASDLPAIKREADRAQCKVRILSRFGLPVLLRRLRRRPVLISGTILVLVATMLLQSFVLFIRVEGNDRISAECILHALEEDKIRFGTWGPSIDSETLKNRMLNQIPELSWLAVNRYGCVATVLCSEREPEEPRLEAEGVTDIIAARSGVIREISVQEGFAVKSPGEAVLAGDLLISGVMEWTVRVQTTRARGEVFADTLRESELICPDMTVKKVYTGRTEICRTIIFQRKRRKISGNSSIFGTMCDRITEIDAWSLPGRYTLPVSIETVTLLEYRLEPAGLTPDSANVLLNAEALRQAEACMVAGSVEQGSTIIQKKGNGYICRAVLNCLELISKSAPAEPLREEELNGKTDQRRTD